MRVVGKAGLAARLVIHVIVGGGLRVNSLLDSVKGGGWGTEIKRVVLVG